MARFGTALPAGPSPVPRCPVISLADLWHPWGKTGREGWHPALAHILDVGSVAEILARHHAVRLAGLLGIDEDEAVRLAVFLIASHDIGRLSPGFQQKAVPEEGRAIRGGCRKSPRARASASITAWSR